MIHFHIFPFYIKMGLLFTYYTYLCVTKLVMLTNAFTYLVAMMYIPLGVLICLQNN